MTPLAAKGRRLNSRFTLPATQMVFDLTLRDPVRCATEVPGKLRDGLQVRPLRVGRKTSQAE